MKLILSEYLRTLKERNELDSLLPRLLLSMNLIPQTKTQTGTRQFGVDLAAVGPDPDDGLNKLFLFVIKRGDLGRAEWDTVPQSIRQSLNEIFDTYLVSQVSNEHKKLPLVIVLAASGDMKEEINLNWTGYVSQKSAQAQFRFWGADALASMIEKFLLNEHIFSADDRNDLRRALALAGEVDYEPESLHHLFRRQLGLDPSGHHDTKKSKSLKLEHKVQSVNLCTRLFNHWAMIQENSKQALITTERALLWTWHRIKNETNTRKRSKLSKEVDSLWLTYEDIGKLFVERLQGHFQVEDGISGTISESAILSVMLFEQIGILASLGLARNFSLRENADDENHVFVESLSSSLVALIRNNSGSGSPRLDEQVIDINLALLFLVLSGKRAEAEEWLEQLVVRVNFAFSGQLFFPVNSIDELLSLEIEFDSAEKTGFNYMSWTLPTLADWCTFFNRSDLYSVLSIGTKNKYPRVCQQLWHPTVELYDLLYFAQSAHTLKGVSEAPVMVPPEIETYKERISKVLQSQDLNFLDSVQRKSFNSGIDFIAYRHFRTLVPPVVLYSIFFKDEIACPAV